MLVYLALYFLLQPCAHRVVTMVVPVHHLEYVHVVLDGLGLTAKQVIMYIYVCMYLHTVNIQYIYIYIYIYIYTSTVMLGIKNL